MLWFVVMLCFGLLFGVLLGLLYVLMCMDLLELWAWLTYCLHWFEVFLEYFLYWICVVACAYYFFTACWLWFVFDWFACRLDCCLFELVSFLLRLFNSFSFACFNFGEFCVWFMLVVLWVIWVFTVGHCLVCCCV